MFYAFGRKTYLQKQGIRREFTCRHTPQQNRVAERKNRHIVKVARAMMNDKNLPNSYWAEAANTTLYLMNKCTTSGVHDVTPYEKFFGKKSDLSHTRIFGSIAYVHIPDEKRQKLDPKLEKCILVGYSLEQNWYKCYNPYTRKVRVSRDVVFDELASWYEPTTSSTPTSLDRNPVELEIEDDNRFQHMFEESPTSTRLGGLLEPLSDQSTSRPSPKMDKGKAKMPEYENQVDNESRHSLDKGKAKMPEYENQVDNESRHSLDIEFECLDTVMQTNGAKKVIETANEKLRCSTRK